MGEAGLATDHGSESKGDSSEPEILVAVNAAENCPKSKSLNLNLILYS